MVCTRNNCLCIFLDCLLDHFWTIRLDFNTFQIEFKPFVSWMFKSVSWITFLTIFSVMFFGQFLDRCFDCFIPFLENTVFLNRFWPVFWNLFY